MAKYSDNMTNTVLKDINETKQDFINLSIEFEACKMASPEDHTTSFNVKAAALTACREKQASAGKLATLCKDNVAGSQTIKNSQCTSTVLTQPISELEAICKPSAQQPLGEWLTGMKAQFDAKVGAFEKQEGLCKSAQWVLGNATDDCEVVTQNSTTQNNSCDTDLNDIESFSCNWAKGFTSRCSTYDLCYAGVLARYTQKKNRAGKRHRNMDTDVESCAENAVHI